MRWIQGLGMLFLAFMIQVIAYDAHTVLLHSEKNCRDLEKTLNQFKIPFERVERVGSTDEKIYIFDDLSTISEVELPPYFIVFQMEDLTQTPPSEEDLKKWSKAFAVWDFSWGNIGKYRDRIQHYVYLEKESPDIVPFLPLYLPVRALNAYREVLQYSTTHPSDISQHLPAIFCHAVFNEPKVIIEAGIRGGASTVPLYKALQLTEGKLVGIDKDRQSGNVYTELNDPRISFRHMNDLIFCKFSSKVLGGKKMDVVFIDTSHEYEHTKQEIQAFVPLLSKNGMLIFHDSNWSPGLSGVTSALKEFFIPFDETKYQDLCFSKNEITWHMIHYPNCNGLTVLKKI